MKPWSEAWFRDCKRERGRILDGEYRHWCFDWDELTVDETTPEWDCCCCFNCKCGELMHWKVYPFGRTVLEIHEEKLVCPKRRFWNYWKHSE